MAVVSVVYIFCFLFAIFVRAFCLGKEHDHILTISELQHNS